jgi:hypothetical protein
VRPRRRARAVLVALPRERVVRRRAFAEVKRDARERALIWAVGALSFVLLSVWLGWSLSAERRALDRMVPEQRRVIYEHTMESVRSLCQPPMSGDLRSRCRDQAEFLRLFPECGADCQRQIEPLLRRATR